MQEALSTALLLHLSPLIFVWKLLDFGISSQVISVSAVARIISKLSSVCLVLNGDHTMEGLVIFDFETLATPSPQTFFPFIAIYVTCWDIPSNGSLIMYVIRWRMLYDAA